MALATPDTILHQQQHYYQTTKREDLEGAQKVSDAALAYFDKLKPFCVDSQVIYEHRFAHRKQEIESLQSLQEALKIMNGDDIA